LIKITAIGYQGDTVQATVEYDLYGETHSFTVGAKLSLIYGMTVEDIRTYVVGSVESERSTKLRALVEAKLDCLVGVDLEAE
jgi:hypothetical protein